MGVPVIISTQLIKISLPSILLNLHNVKPIGLYLCGVLVAKIPNFLLLSLPGYFGGITLLPTKP
jgi:hypothetical protein